MALEQLANIPNSKLVGMDHMDSDDTKERNALVLAQKARIKALEAIVRVQRRLGYRSQNSSGMVETDGVRSYIRASQLSDASLLSASRRDPVAEDTRATQPVRGVAVDRAEETALGADRTDAKDSLIKALQRYLVSKERQAAAEEAHRLRLVRRLAESEQKLAIALSKVAEQENEATAENMKYGAYLERARYQYRRDNEELEQQLELYRARSRRLERELEDARHAAAQELDAATTAHYAVERELRLAIERAAARSDQDRQEAIRLRGEASAREKRAADDVRVLREEWSLVEAASRDEAARWKAEAMRARKVAAKLRAEVRRLRGGGVQEAERFRADVVKGVSAALEDTWPSRGGGGGRKEAAQASGSARGLGGVKDAWVRRHVGKGWVGSDGFGASVGSARRFETGFNESPAWS